MYIRLKLTSCMHVCMYMCVCIHIYIFVELSDTRQQTQAIAVRLDVSETIQYDRFRVLRTPQNRILFYWTRAVLIIVRERARDRD